MLTIAPLDAHAEGPALPYAPTLKPLTSKLGGFTMDVPADWRVNADAGKDRLLFAYDFYNQSFEDYIAIRAENVKLGEVLLGEQFLPSQEDLVADSWASVIQDPITPEKMGLWIMRHPQRKASGAVVGLRGKEVSEAENTGPGSRRDDVTDATLVNGGQPQGTDGSTLMFHVRTTVVNQEGEVKTRFWSNKAVLRNGTVSVGYVTAAEMHWLSNYTGPVNGLYLDGIAGSLRLMPSPALVAA